MAKITDPDNLNQGVELVFDTANKTIQLLKAGNLSDDGVTLQAIYSFCKEEWKNDAALIRFPFPLVAITEKKYDIVNGWDFKDATTRNLIRDAGWALKDQNNVSLEEYMGFITLGSVGASDQIYYQQSSNGDPTNVVLTGPANQAVKIYGDGTHGNFDYRSYFKCFVREYGKLYDQSQLSAIGESAVTYQVYAFPLGNNTDLKITHNDAAMTGAPYSGMSITYYGANQQRSIGGSPYNFNVIVNGNGGTKEQIYEYVQYRLRQDVDIDAGAGTVKGKTAASLLKFVGDTLITSNGVYIDNFAAGDTNSIEFYDVTGTKRTFPYVAAGVISFNDYLKNDAQAIFKLYFKNDDAGTNLGKDFGTAQAIIVKDNAGVDIGGLIAGRSSVSFTFDYDGNVQRGAGSQGKDAPVVAVAIGLTTGQYVMAEAVITKSNANSISLVAALERNYANN